MDNMKIWNAVKRPPESALKPIVAGRLSGKTDISPQWRLQVMTEQFGQCGEGWGYSIERLWTEPGVDGQVFAFAQLSLWAGDKEKRIDGIGGSMLVQKEKNGLHCNDEAFKMAVTDALSVAMKALGVAADIYLGLWDGSKYKTTVIPESAKSVPQSELDKLSDERKKVVADLSVEIIDTFRDTGADEAFDLYEQAKNNLVDEREQIALWGMFASDIKSGIKKIGTQRKEQK